MKIQYIILISFWGITSSSFSQTPLLNKLIDSNKVLTAKLEVYKTQNENQGQTIRGLLLQNTIDKKEKDYIIKSLGELKRDYQVNLPALTDQIDLIKLKLDKLTGSKQEIENFSNKLDEGLTNIKNEIFDLAKSIAGIEKTLKEKGLNDVIKKSQDAANNDGDVIPQNNDDVIPQNNNYLKPKKENDSPTLLIFTDIGGLYTFKKKYTTLSTHLAIGINPGKLKNVFLGVGAGVNSYVSFIAYPVTLSLGFTFSDENSEEKLALIAEAGYSFIKEKYEIIDNFQGNGLFYNVGLKGEISKKHFAPTLMISYKGQQVKELFSALKDYHVTNYSSLNVSLGIKLKF